MQEGGQGVQAIYSLETHVDWSGFRKCHGTRPHTQKFTMPMTAASVAQRRMGFKAPGAQKYEGQSPYLVSQGFSRGGSDK